MSESVSPLGPAVEIAGESLLQNSKSSFASLAILASLRIGDTYSQPYLAQRLGERLLHRAVVKLHKQVFYEWLKTPLDDQKIAVEEHIRETGRASAKEVTINSFQPYIPPSAEPPERKLFKADLLIILALLKAGQLDSPAVRNSIVWRLAVALQTARRCVGDRKLTLKRISCSLRISPNYLGRAFHDRAGVTFREYLLLVRMFMAADMLRSKATSLKSLANTLGYGNESNFSRDFLKVYRRGPALYRFTMASDQPLT